MSIFHRKINHCHLITWKIYHHWSLDMMMMACHDHILTENMCETSYCGYEWRWYSYILKVGISGIRDSANFFHFPPKFRLRTRKLSRLHCTIASPSVCRLCCLIAALKLLQNLYSNLSSQYKYKHFSYRLALFWQFVVENPGFV